jgi:hypothetical protein
MNQSVEFKICSKCGIENVLDDFHKNKYGQYGVHSICKECKNKYKKEYREKNKDEINRKNKEYENKNTEKIKIRKKKYHSRKDIKYIDNERMKKFYKDNPHVRAWRSLLYSTLKRMNKPKEGHTIDLLGYSALDLKLHLESLFTEGMTWDNHGEWHIDHIKQIILFNKDTDPSIVNTLSNLRPLWATTREINGITYEGNLNRSKYQKSV